MKNELMQLNNYKAKRAITKIVTDIFRYIFLIAYSYVLIYPIVFLIIRSIELGVDVYDPTVQWVPKELAIDSFKVAIKAMDFWGSLGNTFFYEMIASLLPFSSQKRVVLPLPS